MTKVKIMENGQQLEERKFDYRFEAECFVADLLQRSPQTWTFDPGNDEWSCGQNIVQLVDVAETVPERIARIGAKIATVEGLIAEVELKLQAGQTKLVQLNADLVGLQQEKAVLEGS